MNKSLAPFVGESWVFPIDEALTIFMDVIAPQLRGLRDNEEKEIVPSESVVFRALKECPFDALRVVVLGQDPYHTRGLATGLAFDASTGNPKPPSLKNILKELSEDLGESYVFYKAKSSYLEHLPPQGVLLLNTALTTQVGQPAAHANIWKPFSEALVKALQRKNNLVWLLWGEHAKKFKKLITNPTHKIVEGAHPSPFSYHLFKGGKYFSKVNDYLGKNKIKF